MNRLTYYPQRAHPWIRKWPRWLVRCVTVLVIPVQVVLTVFIAIAECGPELRHNCGALVRCAFGRWEEE